MFFCELFKASFVVDDCHISIVLRGAMQEEVPGVHQFLIKSY